MTRDGPRWSASAVALAALPLGFLLAMLLAPTLRLMAEAGSAGTGGFDRSAWLAPVLDSYVRWRLLWSLVQALLTCGLVLLIGVPLAWVLARWEFAGRRWLLRALMLPFVVPTLVAAMGVLALAGPQGLWPGGASQSWQGTPVLLLYGNVFLTCACWCALPPKAWSRLATRAWPLHAPWVPARGGRFGGSSGRRLCPG